MDKSELIQSVKDVVNKHNDVVKEAWLFGSITTDKFHRTSDIDLAVDCGDDYMGYIALLDDLETINTIRRFDVHNISDCGFAFGIEEIKDGIKVL